MKIKKEFVTFVPVWAVPVLCNGPDGSESDEDIALIDGFYQTLAKWGYTNPTFDFGNGVEDWQAQIVAHPDFGKACDAVETRIVQFAA